MAKPTASAANGASAAPKVARPEMVELKRFAAQVAKTHGLDAGELFQDARVEFWKKTGKDSPDDAPDASLFRGIINNVRKRHSGDAAKRMPSAARGGAASEIPEEVSRSELAITFGRDVVCLDTPGKRALSECWATELLPILALGQPHPAMIELPYASIDKRMSLLRLIVRRVLHVVVGFEIDGEHGSADEPVSTLYRGMSEKELARAAERISTGLSDWVKERFPLRGACSQCGTGTSVFDCQVHSIRGLLRLPGAPGSAESRGASTHRSWGGWNAPADDETMKSYRSAFGEYAERCGRVAQLKAIEGAQADPLEVAQAEQFESDASGKLAALSDELDNRFERRFIFGPEDATREYRVKLAARAFLLELCRLARINPAHVDEVAVDERKDIAKKVADFIANARASGDVPPRHTRKPGRPKKQPTPKTRRRGPRVMPAKRL